LVVRALTRASLSPEVLCISGDATETSALRADARSLAGELLRPSAVSIAASRDAGERFFFGDASIEEHGRSGPRLG
jgi:hypothetical protein